jgi:hypothetical protein
VVKLVKAAAPAVGIFKVVPVKVAAPEPVVVNEMAPCLPLKVFQSVVVKYPLAAVVAAGIDTVFKVLDNGALNANGASLPVVLPVIGLVTDKLANVPTDVRLDDKKLDGNVVADELNPPKPARV